jgi:hypothetical protein
LSQSASVEPLKAVEAQFPSTLSDLVSAFQAVKEKGKTYYFNNVDESCR